MRTLTLIALAALTAGCSSSPTYYPSRVDDNFGQAVLGARARQTIDPDASSRQRAPAGIDGQAAKAAIDRYEKSFETPPPPVNVFNIGVGSAGAGGSVAR